MLNIILASSVAVFFLPTPFGLTAAMTTFPFLSTTEDTITKSALFSLLLDLIIIHGLSMSSNTCINFSLPKL